MDDLETELYFKRFPPEKQATLRELISYTTLLGLTGKDLISIGGRLDRIKLRSEIMANRAIVHGMKLDTIGEDTDLRTRWSYTTDNGRYNFKDVGYSSIRIHSVSTDATRKFTFDRYQYNVGNSFPVKGSRYAAPVMLAVHFGDIKLDF